MGRLARSRLSTNNRNSSRQAPTGSERGESVIFDVGFLILPAFAAPTPAPTLVGAGRGRDTVRVNVVLKLEV